MLHKENYKIHLKIENKKNIRIFINSFFLRLDENIALEMSSQHCVVDPIEVEFRYINL